MCVKFAKYFGMIFGTVAVILVLLGVIGFLMWVINHAAFLNVANFWNFLMASIPFSLLAICCTLFAASDKEKS
jgi:hypothetical protein